jgi:hypothetical protein
VILGAAPIIGFLIAAIKAQESICLHVLRAEASSDDLKAGINGCIEIAVSVG